MILGEFLLDCRTMHYSTVIEVALGRRVSASDEFHAFRGKKVGYLTVAEAISQYGDEKIINIEYQKDGCVLFSLEDAS